MSNLVQGVMVERGDYKYLLLSRHDNGIWNALNMTTMEQGQWYDSYFQEKCTIVTATGQDKETDVRAYIIMKAFENEGHVEMEPVAVYQLFDEASAALGSMNRMMERKRDIALAVKLSVMGPDGDIDARSYTGDLGPFENVDKALDYYYNQDIKCYIESLPVL